MSTKRDGHGVLIEGGAPGDDPGPVRPVVVDEVDGAMAVAVPPEVRPPDEEKPGVSASSKDILCL